MFFGIMRFKTLNCSLFLKFMQKPFFARVLFASSLITKANQFLPWTKNHFEAIVRPVCRSYLLCVYFWLSSIYGYLVARGTPLWLLYISLFDNSFICITSCFLLRKVENIRCQRFKVGTSRLCSRLSRMIMSLLLFDVFRLHESLPIMSSLCLACLLSGYLQAEYFSFVFYAN